MANTLRIKRRISGGPGAPSTLKNAEVAFNEVDKVLYYGWGSDLENDATNVIAIGGEGEFVTRSSPQSITGLKTFVSNTSIQDTLTTSNFVVEGGSVDVTTTQFDIALDATLINLGSASSNVHIAGDLNVDGDNNLTGTLDIGEDLIIAGDLAVNGGDITTTSGAFNLLNTNASTINAFGAGTSIFVGSNAIGSKTTIRSANTDISGYLSVTGDLSVNGGDIHTTNSTASIFTANATDVAIATSATTVDIGASTGTTSINNNLDVDLELNVDGGSITTNQADFNLLNTNATTVNAFGAANTISIGSSTGTTTINNDLSVLGDLHIEGELTTINSTTVSVDDKNIELGSTDTPTDDTANGGGITLKGDTDKTIIWDKVNSDWTSSENWNIASGKEYKIGATSVLSSTTLGSTVLNSSLTTLGTITSGVWHGTEIAATYGGIGQTTYAKGDIVFAGSVNPASLSKLTIGSYDATNEVGQMLQVNSDGTVSWSWNIDGGTF